jgi:hypothetical protein
VTAPITTPPSVSVTRALSSAVPASAGFVVIPSVAQTPVRSASDSVITGTGSLAIIRTPGLVALPSLSMKKAAAGGLLSLKCSAVDPLLTVRVVPDTVAVTDPVT